MSRFEFKLSDIGEGIAEAELVEWLANVGDTVREDQPLAAFMTDKATVELESPVTGKVVSRTGDIGDAIRVGATIMEIEVEGSLPEREEKPEASAPPPQSSPGPAPAPAPKQEAPRAAAPVTPAPPPPNTGKVLASPVVRRRARDLGVDLASVPHSGPRVMNADLDAFLVAAKNPTKSRPTSRLANEEVPVVGMRRAIARKMEEAKRRIPHFTYVEEIDMTEFERLRAALNEDSETKLTALPLLIAAICKTLPEFPQLNAHYYDDKDVVRRFGAVHMGVATQTDAGLMVPVIHDADGMDPAELSREIASVAAASRSGKIAREKLQGSTITLSSLGKLGGIAATPILNAPEVCIIGPNKMIERPMWRDGVVVPRMMMNLSISCDHRVVDGYDAAAFVQALKRKLEIPALIFAAR